MSRKDRIQDELHWLRLITAAILTANFSLIGWLFTRTSTAVTGLSILAFTAVVEATIGLVLVAVIVLNKLKSLEECDDRQ